MLLVLWFLGCSGRSLLGHHVIYYRVFKLLLRETTFDTFVRRLHQVCSRCCIWSNWKSSCDIWRWILLKVVVWGLIKVASWIVVILTVILWIVKRLIVCSSSIQYIILLMFFLLRNVILRDFFFFFSRDHCWRTHWEPVIFHSRMYLKYKFRNIIYHNV